jgi:hypothetical protein
MRLSGCAIFLVWFVLGAVGLSARVARAQEEGGGEGGEGGEESFVEPFAEANAEPPELPESDETEGRLERETDPHPDNVIWTLGGGGTLSYGNARTGGLNLSTSFGVRRGNEVLVIDGSFLYAIAQSPLSCGAVQANPTEHPVGTVAFCGPSGTGMAARARAPGFTDWAETAVNLNWRLRYDHFFDANNAFYLLHRGRIDRFAGIRPRVGLSIGYSRIVFEELQHMLAIDLGVDGTFDFFPESIVAQTQAIVMAGGALPNLSGTDARFVPSVRVGVSYVNHLNPFLTYDTMFEALWDVANQTHFRFEWVNHLRSAIDTTFQIRLDVTFRLDGLPPGQARAWVEDATVQTTTMFEVLTTLNLVGTFDLDGEPVYQSSAPEEAAHDESPPR